MENKYKCKYCGKVVTMNSDKKWIKSECEETRVMTRLIKIEFNHKLIDKLCREYLPKGRDLSTFSKKEIIHLEMAFVQGANVMMNYIK